MRRVQLVVCFLLGGAAAVCLGPSRPDPAAGAAPKGVPRWFQDLDANGDGQVSLREWLAAGRARGDFRKHDRTNDGFITEDEVLHEGQEGARLELVKGQANFSGDIEISANEAYRNRRAFKAFTVRLEAGRSYEIEMVSPVYWAALFLESPDGALVDRHNSNNNGEVSRIVHQAAKSGTYRLIATSLGGFRTGPFTLSIREVGSGGARVVKGLPPWFRRLDGDGDGQVSLREWLDANRARGDFRKFDLDSDGFITPDEMLRAVKEGERLELVNGRASFSGAIEMSSELYRGRRAFKAFTVRLHAGRTYQIEMLSQVYWSYLMLEGPDGTIVDQNNSGANGRAARVVHRPSRTGTYRVIATSAFGFQAGPCTLTVIERGGPPPADSRGLPPWFRRFDADGDGRVSLAEWLAAGGRADEHGLFDQNEDGSITPEEVLPTPGD
jgi:hypothetical protein